MLGPAANCAAKAGFGFRVVDDKEVVTVTFEIFDASFIRL
jgi:hypothetical protein